jgi:hypothetical protein
MNGMSAYCGGKWFSFENWGQVSKAYRRTCEALGLGPAEAPRCVILDDAGAIVAHVAYNGRVWAGPVYHARSTSLYDPVPA